MRNRGVLEVVQFNSLNSKMRKLSSGGKRQITMIMVCILGVQGCVKHCAHIIFSDFFTFVTRGGIPSRASEWALVPLGTEVSEETCADSVKDITGQAESSRVREPRRITLSHVHSLRF